MHLKSYDKSCEQSAGLLFLKQMHLGSYDESSEQSL